MSELDKFKRRLIRSVGHMLRQDGDKEAAWEQMHRRTGTNCKKLWERMRALTMKKLRRLILAEDKVDSLPVVVRLSLTDWLLFDLVLTHEKYDVIGRDLLEKGREPLMLYDLTHLVAEMRIEKILMSMQADMPSGYYNKAREALIDAWLELTMKYNTNGRQCSPMLLQRRWYQLKELTRHNFYRLWCRYRGNPKLWEEAKQLAPSPLQSYIAGRFPNVVTTPFEEWDEMVQNGKVIMPEDFDKKRRKKNLSKSSGEDKPDVEMIEPEIETIDLGVESDEEGKERQPGPSRAPNVNLSLVKQEPVEADGLSNVQILEATHIPSEVISEPEDEIIEDEENLQVETNDDLKLQVANFMQRTESPLADAANDGITMKQESMEDESVDIHIPEEADQEGVITETDTFKEEDTGADAAMGTNEEDANTAVETGDIDASIDSLIPDDLIKLKAEEYCRKKAENKEAQVKSGDTTTNDITENAVDDIIKKKADDFVRKVDLKKLVNEMVDEYNAPADMSFIDDGIEFVDDGIEYDEDDDDAPNLKIKEEITEPVVKKEPEIPDLDAEVEDPNKAEQTVITDRVVKTKTKQDGANEETKNKNGKADKFDLKLLMVPVVYTTKLENMTTFKGKMYDSISEPSLINGALIESKPIIKKNFKIVVNEATDVKTSVQESDDDVHSNLITSEYCDQNLNDDLVTNRVKTVLNEAIHVRNSVLESDDDVKSNLITGKNCDQNLTDDLVTNRFDSDLQQDPEFPTNVNIPDNLRIKSTSYLLQKPRSRSYHPIQLCKNPDFNTRLKRLTAGFFSYTRNRHLLSACKPMTIDLSKAFEPKLVNGTLYLKTSGELQPVVSKEENLQQSSVMPSAMPVQSLLNSTPTNIEDLVPTAQQIPIVDLTKRNYEAERNKVINLRDLAEIRRINQKLLTAEVPPIRMETRVKSTDNLIVTTQDRNTEHATTERQTKFTPQVEAIEENNLEKDVNTLLENYIAEEPKITKTGEPQIVTIPDKKPINTTNSQIGNEKSELKRIDPWNMPRCRPGPRPGFKNLSKKPQMVLNSVTREPVTWNKFQNNPVTSKDSLLTLDTLNKMITKLQGNEPNVWGKKKKAYDVTMGDRTEVSKDKPAEENVDLTKTEAEAQLNKEAKEKRAQNYRNKKSEVFCCWARERYEKKNRRSKYSQHPCGHSVCICCCRNLLATYVRSQKEAANRAVKDGIYIPRPRVKVRSGPKTTRPVTSIQSSVTSSVQSSVTSSLQSSVTSSIQTSLASTSTSQISEQPMPVFKVNISFKPPPPIINPTSENLHISTKNENMLKSLMDLNDVDMTMPAGDPIYGNLETYKKPLKRIIIPVSALNKANQGGTILIDGSLNNPIVNIPIRPKKDESFMFLNSSNIQSKPKESPIFLGKNKILLTTVKFPPNFDGQQNKPVMLPPKIIPALPLPTGVQLAMMDDGSLQFTIEPGVQLNEQEMNLLPLILAEVQQQLDVAKAKGGENISNVSDFVDITQDDDKITPTTNSALSTTESTGNFQSSEIVPVATTSLDSNNSGTVVSNGAIVESTTNEFNSSEVIVEDTANDLNSSTGSEIISVTGTENTVAEENNKEVNDISVGSRNLLSDLMEMSGILAEDIVPSHQESVHQDLGGLVQENAQIEPEIATQVPTVPGISAEFIVSSQNESVYQDLGSLVQGNVQELLETTTQIPNVQENLTQINQVDLTGSQVSVPVITAEQNVLPELTTVTSLAELRYACEQNGKFFKLDFVTGVLVPINVQIKKKVISKHSAPISAPKGVIDLTDDIVDISAPKETSENETVELTNSMKTTPVKPLRLFRANKTQPILMKKANPNSLIKDLRKLPVIRKHKRKQEFLKIEAKIDLVDSDAPMEEEYLVDSSGSESPRAIARSRKRTVQPISEADDSSDDEPLAKKSLRIRAKESDVLTPESEKAEPIKEQISQESGGVNIASNEQVSSVEPPEVSEEIEIDPSMDKVGDAVVSDDENMDIDESIASNISFLECNEEPPEEDCILGV